MLAMLTARNLPQTLLLTVRFLLIAVATTLLACGPAAQTAPAGDVILPAAQVSGGGEPMAEPEDPTPEPEPTATPTPYPTNCIVMPEDLQGITELAEGQVRRDGLLLQCFVVTPVPPTPTPKYPHLGDALSRYAVEAEDAQADASQAGGASGASYVETPSVYVDIVLSANTEEVVAWLQRNGVPLSSNWVEGDLGYIVAYRADWDLGDDFIYAWVPASLLVALSRQEGVSYIEDASYLIDTADGN